MKQGGRSWALGLAITLGLMALVLVLLPGTAHTQGSAPANGLDCKDPPTGERVILLEDAEIVYALRRDKVQSLEYGKLNYKSGSFDERLFQVRESSFHDYDALSDIRWPAITTADLAGDGHRQPVLALQDKEDRIAVATSRRAAPDNLTYWYAEWTHGQGKDLGWVDVAAGNLDRSENGDEEVVLAFRDAYGMLLVAVLDKHDLDRPNASTAIYGEDDTHGRSKVHNVSVATGDLDGDGYDNEIVVAFAEERGPLQVMVFRLSGAVGPNLS